MIMAYDLEFGFCGLEFGFCGLDETYFGTLEKWLSLTERGKEGGIVGDPAPEADFDPENI